VLRQRELAEADRILQLLSRERGKISALAKGVKRPRSKLAGGLQLFSHVRLLLAAGRQLDLITQCEPIESFLPLREDLDRFALASHLVELTDSFMEEGAPLPGLFDLLLNSLRGLAGSPAPDLIARGFELKLTALLGYAPQLAGCVSCGRQFRPEAPGAEGPPAAKLRSGFSVSLGGLVCDGCRSRTPGLVSLSGETVGAMRRLLKLSPQETSGLGVSARACGELEGVLRSYLEHRLERRLRSVSVLGALRAASPAREETP
jgi:DNA repair protein RecO (recombination protein O)